MKLHSRRGGLGWNVKRSLDIGPGETFTESQFRQR